MHSNVTIKNVSWPHFSWPTLYSNQLCTVNYLGGRCTWLPGRKWNLWSKVPASAGPGRQRRPYSASCRSTSGRKRSARRPRSRWPRDGRTHSVRTSSGRTAHAPSGWRHRPGTWRWNVPTDNSLSCRRRRRRRILYNGETTWELLKATPATGVEAMQV